MRKIHRIIHSVKEELCGAQEYAEKYIEKKGEDNSAWANRYREMANDELRHASYLHELLAEKANEIRSVYKLKEDDEEAIERCNKKYAERSALIKQMLSV